MRSNQLDHTAIICPGKCVLFNSPETGISASEFQHVVWLILTLINSLPPPPTRYSSNSSSSRRRHGGEETKGPKRRVCIVWAISTFFLIVQFIHESSRRPTAANEGQRWPTKRKRGPNDARHIVWALGAFFVLFFCVLLTTTAPNNPRHVVWAVS